MIKNHFIFSVFFYFLASCVPVSKLNKLQVLIEEQKKELILLENINNIRSKELITKLNETNFNIRNLKEKLTLIETNNLELEILSKLDVDVLLRKSAVGTSSYVLKLSIQNRTSSRPIPEPRLVPTSSR